MSMTAQKERTPEQIAAAKARMAKVRSAKKPKEVMPPAHNNSSPDMRPRPSKAGGAVEHKRAEVLESVSAEYTGFTANDCGASCRLERCVITHLALCGHPMKGGLQSAQMMQPDVVKRFNEVKKILAHQKVDARRDD